MKVDEVRKIIREEIKNILSEGFDDVDSILDALIKGKITKKQAKQYLMDISNVEDNNTSQHQMSFGCGSSPSHSSNFGCGGSQGTPSRNVRC